MVFGSSRTQNSLLILCPKTSSLEQPDRICFVSYLRVRIFLLNLYFASLIVRRYRSMLCPVARRLLQNTLTAVSLSTRILDIHVFHTLSRFTRQAQPDELGASCFCGTSQANWKTNISFFPILVGVLLSASIEPRQTDVRVAFSEHVMIRVNHVMIHMNHVIHVMIHVMFHVMFHVNHVMIHVVFHVIHVSHVMIHVVFHVNHVMVHMVVHMMIHVIHVFQVIHKFHVMIHVMTHVIHVMIHVNRMNHVVTHVAIHVMIPVNHG